MPVDKEKRRARQVKYQRAYRSRNRAKTNASASAWYRAHAGEVLARKKQDRADPGKKAKMDAATRRWREAHPDKVRKNWLASALRKYNISVERYEQLLVEQHGVCAICHEPEVVGKRLSVDHDHTTDEVRGLLCMACNILLGKAKENPATLLSAVAYLQREKKGAT